MIAIYLGLTAFLAVLDAIGSLSALVSGTGTGDPGVAAVAQGLWLLVSIPILFLFLNRGYWPGAPIAHIAYVASGAFVYAAVPVGSLLLPAFRLVGSLALLVLVSLMLRAVVTNAADDGEPPPNVAQAAAVAAVLAAAGAAVAVRINPPSRPEPVIVRTPVPAAPVERTVTVFGRVLRPDGITLPGTMVTFETDAPAAARFRVRGETTVKADRQGRYSFSGTSMEQRPPFRLTFVAPGYKKKTVDATVTGEGLDVTLSPDL